jgi:hypothetical protein
MDIVWRPDAGWVSVRGCVSRAKIIATALEENLMQRICHSLRLSSATCRRSPHTAYRTTCRARTIAHSISRTMRNAQRPL